MILRGWGGKLIRVMYRTQAKKGKKIKIKFLTQPIKGSRKTKWSTMGEGILWDLKYKPISEQIGIP